MEKTFKSSDNRAVGYGSAYAIKSDHPDYLVGRLLTIIETLGLPDRQEKSFKDLVRFEVYNSLNLTTWMPPNLHNLVVDYYEWYQDESPRLAEGKSENRGNQYASVKRGQEPVDHTMKGEFTITYKE